MKKGMKTYFTYLLLLLMMFSFCACQKEDVAVQEQTVFCAYIQEIKGDTILLDFAEYIDTEDAERIAELKLTEYDMPSGYYIYNPEVLPETYTLTEDTIYNFIDWGNDFVEKGYNSNVSTTDKEMFIEYLNTYENATPGMPFFFEINGNEIISITEKWMA